MARELMTATSGKENAGRISSITLFSLGIQMVELNQPFPLK